MFFDNYFNDINSSGPLFYMNELSINGKQVTNDDEDEDEDYTAIEDDYDTDDEDVDIDDEDNDLEDYTEDDSYENDGEDNNQDANVEDDEDTDYTAIQDDNGTEQTTDAAEENNDNTDDTDVDVDADDDTAADDDTENKNATDGNSDLPDPEADLKDAIGDTGGGGDGADGGTDAGSDGASNNTPGEVDDLTAENPDSGGVDEENKGDAANDNDQNPKGANTDDTSNDDPNSLKSLEKDLFADLTPEQLSIKNSELLQNYIDLYDSLETIFDNVNKIPKTYTNTRAIEFIADKLVELKEMVNQVITTTYITKTYVENLTVYKQCLLMLQQLNTMLKGLVQHQSK